MLCNLNPSMLKPPNKNAARSALIGFQAANITSATAIQPLPPTTSTCQMGTVTRERYAPPKPQNAPPKIICTYLYRATCMPEASAAAAFSPTALIFNPTLVLSKYIVDRITITYPKYTKESCRKKTGPNNGMSDNSGMLTLAKLILNSAGITAPTISCPTNLENPAPNIVSVSPVTT